MSDENKTLTDVGEAADGFPEMLSEEVAAGYTVVTQEMQETVSQQIPQMQESDAQPYSCRKGPRSSAESPRRRCS